MKAKFFIYEHIFQTKEKKAEKDPAYKKFSDPSGSYMELAPYGITFSPGSSSTSMLLDKSGMLSISGKKLSFLSNTTIYIGGGKEGPIPEIFAMAEKEIKAALTGGDSSITMKTDTDIKATFVKKDAELKKPALPLASAVEKELTAEDKATRDGYNADCCGQAFL